MSVGEAADYTTVPRRTLQRRLSAWLDGRRDAYAIRCVRAYGTSGDRLVNALDAERVRLQEHDRLDRSITADQYAAMVDSHG